MSAMRGKVRGRNEIDRDGREEPLSLGSAVEPDSAVHLVFRLLGTLLFQ